MVAVGLILTGVSGMDVFLSEIPTVLLLMPFFETLIHAMKFALEMAWVTWWGLVLGFTIAGAVKSFISEERMIKAIGGKGQKSVLLGTLFGAASSNCSFSAVATTKSLFKKGASQNQASVRSSSPAPIW